MLDLIDKLLWFLLRVLVSAALTQALISAAYMLFPRFVSLKAKEWQLKRLSELDPNKQFRPSGFGWLGKYTVDVSVSIGLMLTLVNMAAGIDKLVEYAATGAAQQMTSALGNMTASISSTIFGLAGSLLAYSALMLMNQAEIRAVRKEEARAESPPAGNTASMSLAAPHGNGRAIPALAAAPGGSEMRNATSPPSNPRAGSGLTDTTQGETGSQSSVPKQKQTRNQPSKILQMRRKRLQANGRKS